MFSFSPQNVHILPRLVDHFYLIRLLLTRFLSRKIYLSLTAESLDLVEDSGRLGGDESGRLTPAGMSYSLDLARYIHSKQENMHDLGKSVLVLAGKQLSIELSTLLYFSLRNG